MMNPMQFMNMMQNPKEFLNQMMNNSNIMQNPMTKNVVEMYKSGDSKGLQEMAENLAREKGTDVNTVKNEIMKHFGMN